MPGRVPIHDVNPFIQKVREFLLGRKHTLALRFQQDIATRTPPPPVLPDGPAHILSANYYCSRDARREVAPPEVIASSQKQIAGGGSANASVSNPKGVTPGKVYRWD